ncbi:MAG: sugar phosphate isomerase [bacterium]
MGAHSRARKFVEEETQYQLGFLVTEQSHPRTSDLGEATRRDPKEGVRRLLAVDEDVVRSAPDQLAGDGFQRLCAALATVADTGRRIVFSGCGSTGRLAVLLESIWRHVWLTRNKPEVAGRARGIITGGDRALIRSVESFEDYEEFGREQTRELGLGRGDIFVAISEGGETSSVIGSARQAIDDGCEVFFLFNNPTDLLRRRLERSRVLIDDPRVTAIDLTTGPMALAGSTRMQAITAELFFIGTAIESAVAASTDRARHDSAERRARARRACEGLSRLVEDLACPRGVDAIAGLVEREAAVYLQGEMVLYSVERHLLDVFADTTERSPTFSVPPLKRASDGPEVPRPWSAAYHPVVTGGAAWRRMLGRDPVGLDWSAETYRRLGVPELAADPQELGRNEILSYPVGTEVPDRYADSAGLVLGVRWTRDGDSGALGLVSKHDRTVIPVSAPAGELDLASHLTVKLVFNTLSTATMALLGRVRGNWMIQVTPTNKKLIDRSIRIVSALRGVDYADAAALVFDELEARGGANESIVYDLLERV